jgi:rhodanese-related sulfurtransferase
MTQAYALLDPRSVWNTLESGAPAMLVDVRTRAEFYDGHALGAESIPLDEISRDRLNSLAGPAGIDETVVYLLCASGERARQAASKLSQQGLNNIVVVDGGTQAWREHKLPTRRTSRLPSLERQTQIALGLMLLLIVVKGAVLHPLFYLLTAMVAIGLIVAGVSARCSLTALLARMPWNRSQDHNPA